MCWAVTKTNTSNSFISVVKLHHLPMYHHSTDVPLAARRLSRRRRGAIIAGTLSSNNALRLLSSVPKCEAVSPGFNSLRLKWMVIKVWVVLELPAVEGAITNTHSLDDLPVGLQQGACRPRPPRTKMSKVQLYSLQSKQLIVP